MTVVEWCVSGAKDLRFIDREFHKRGGGVAERSIGKLEPDRNRWKGKTQMI